MNIAFLATLIIAFGLFHVHAADDDDSGSSSFPTFANCPPLTVSNYFTFKPDVSSNCLPQLLCEQAFCTCNSVPLINNYTCGTNFSQFRSQTVFESCGPAYLRCLVNASLQLVNASDVNATRHTCAGWANPFVSDYAIYYNTNAKDVTNIVQMCYNSICNAEMIAFNQTNAYLAQLCALAFLSLPAPPPTAGAPPPTSTLQCNTDSVNLFANLPVTTCPTVSTCVVISCACVAGTYLGSGICLPPSDVLVTTSQRCVTALLNCVVNAALTLYVPGAAETNPLVDTCVRWSVPIARAYQTYYGASNKQTTDLYVSCNTTACQTLGYATLLAPSCGFSAVTRAPAYVAPNPCPFVCPDATCSFYLGSCACVANAQLYNVSAQFTRSVSYFDVTNSLNAVAFGTYRVLSGNCSGYDFNPNMRFTWIVSNATTPVVLNVNSSSLSIPPLTLAPSSYYLLTLIVRGFTDATYSIATWTVMTVAPTPIVSITQNGVSLRASNAVATVLAASVVDAFPGTSPSFSWTCASLTEGVECPVLTNNTISRLTIPANSATGNFTITFTYKAVTSRLNITIVAGSIPTVRVVQTSLPVVAVPALYVQTQTITLASSVSGYAGNVTYMWTLNGVTIGTGKSLSVNASALVASESWQLTEATPQPNVIVLRVTAATSASVYGEATLVVAVAPVYTISLTVSKLGDSSATSATALTDSLQLEVATNLGVAPYALASSFAFTFVSSATTGLVTTPTSSANFFTAVAPMPFTTATGTTAVTFGAQLLIGGVVVASTSDMFNIATPSDLASAAAAQIALATTVTDSSAGLSVVSNIQTLMLTTTNLTTRKELAAAAVTLLVNTVSDFSTQSSQQQATVFTTLTTALSSTTDATQLAAMQAQTLTLMTSAVSSASFDPANSNAALQALASVSIQNSQSVIAALAVKMANDPTQAAGAVRTISAPGITIATVKQSASNLGGLAVSDGSTSLTIADGFVLPGASSSDLVSIAQASFDANPFNASSGVSTPNSKVVSIQFNINDQAANVSGLTTELAIALTGGSGVCRYWKESTSVWDTAGVRTEVRNGVLTCLTNHLTSFGSFPSSSATTTVMSVVAVLMVLFANILA